MSRLTALHVPFVSGHDDSAAARVLPDGVFADVQNGRLRKSGELALRRGWRPLDMTEMATANDFVAHDIYSYGDSLVALGTLGASAAQRLATYVASAPTRPWRAYTDAAIPPVTDVTFIGNVSDMSEDLWYASYALTDDSFGCAAYQYTDGALTTTITRVFDTATQATVAAFSDTSGYVKVFSLGSTIGRVRLEGTNLVYATLNPTDTSPAFATVATLEAGVTADSPFDVVFTTGFLHVVVVDGGAATYRRYSSTTGAQSGADKTVTAADVTHFPAIACDGTTAHVLTKTDAADVLSILTFAATGAYATSAGPTALFSSAAIDASRFCIGKDASVVYVAAQLDAANDVGIVALDAAHAVLESDTHRSCVLVSGWVLSDPYAGVGLARESTHGDGVGSFCYADTSGPWLWSQAGIAEGGPDNSLTNVPGRVVSPAKTNTLVLVGGFARREAFAAPFTLFFSIGSTERRPGAVFGSTLYLTGGVLTQWSGSDAVENGIAAPVIRSLTQGTIGSLTQLATYSYRAVVTWFDEARGLHRSVVSDALNVTLTGVNDSIIAVADVGKTLRRNGNVGSNPTVSLYRTEAGPGELFYRVRTQIVDTTADSTTFLNDNQADSAIIDNPRLYTEGEFGAVSGVLDIASPRPSAYVATMRDRLVLGEIGPAYQVSQTLLPEEPVAFAEPGVSGPAALAYFDSVEGRLTGVATLDDTIVLGTADAIYVAGGEGPNLAGVGSFQSPARLPSDVGFYDWRSIVETSEGLWFLGAEDKLYLLPRGGGVPKFAGKAVQDRFTGPVVGCARDMQDSIVAWAVAGDTPALVVHDVDHGYWFTDPLPFTPVALTTHQGRMYGVAADGVVWAQDAAAYGDGTAGAEIVALRTVTGHVQVFGQVGQGRVGAITVLGGVVSAASLEAEISYNDGVSWATLGSYALTGTTGDTFQVQFYPANQRGGRFRLRLTMVPTATTAEGCRLTGFTVHYRTANGPSRLPAASRK
jgi:hypothetical protein